MNSQKQKMKSLNKYLNIPIKTIYRIVWADHGYIIDWNRGCLEIHFHDGQILYLLSGSNGMSLLVKSIRWQDPFAGKKGYDSKEYIGEYGKDVRVDVSTIYPFSQLIDEKIEEFKPITSNVLLCGVRIISSETIMNFFTVWDECEITWNSDLDKLKKAAIDILF